MSKITRNKLNRGTKLTVDHVFTPLLDVVNNLFNGTINQENIESNSASFRVNINVPVIDTELANHYVYQPKGFPRGGYCVPFMLPPLQEFYEPQNETVSYNYDTPDLVLDEFSFSFDQRSEPSIITSRFWNHFTAGTNVGENSGMLSYDPTQTGKLELKFVIYEKTPTIFIKDDPENSAGGNQVSAAADVRNMYLENIVFEARVEMLNLINKTYRTNPFVRTEINKIFDPYKSYMIGIYADGLFDTTFPRDGDLNFAFVNCQIGLRFKSQLVETYRSDGTMATPQNSPAQSVKIGPSMAFSLPGSGDVIQADTTDGLQTNMTTVDAVIEGKLKGGLSKWANPPGFESIATDGAYDVIYIPMFSNPFNNIIKNSAAPSSAATGLTHGSINQLPYTDLGNPAVADDNICDKRVITIPYPYEIHHAYACVNYLATTIYAQDALPSIHHDIGIGIGTGIRGDEYTYEQVSHIEWDQKWEDDAGAGFAIPTNLIDRWLVPFRELTPLPKGQSYDGTGAGLIAWEIYSLPMMTGMVNGKGYVTQGNPYFVGKGTGASTNNYSYLGVPARTAVGDNAGGSLSPNTKGAEQFIECRWKISTPDTYNQAPGAGFNNLIADQTIIGYQGNYIVLICKKYLTKGE